ncbi:site-specific tyrosine recombinase XerC [Gimesia panareensis]|uniref:Site-specific tyrosine recombinase XerC n=1 Tax=Gimesia panareensis TaxID=2527978 RepID=A0A517Q435_9PLAN|nr:tyrosine-type recombinase/integrase [Gimesia panareensis]QDT26380.1 site-specific tyrosine recombinase XerC [Gimesia panareensis]
MPRNPEIGNIQIYPNRPLKEKDKNGYVLKFYCPLHQKRIRKNCGTRDRREARRIMRECRERLLNGRYIESGGVITEELEIQTRAPTPSVMQGSAEQVSDMRWQDCFEHYYEHCKTRMRSKSLETAMGRIQIASRIFENYRKKQKLPENANIEEYTTLTALEYLQDRLLAGEEGVYDYRALTTVNTMVGSVMAFVRYCHRHGWISQIPPVTKLSVDEVMKGRPITGDEFEQMLEVTPEVVGKNSAESWRYVLQIIWESAFRIGDVMNFSWDDERKIHPVWPQRKDLHPTLIIPSSQKNGKTQEIPMLPGLQKILDQIPQSERHGWVVNPQSMEYQIKADSKWFRPTNTDLQELAKEYNNSAIARACRVSETTVRKWLSRAKIKRMDEFNRHQGEIDSKSIAKLRKRAEIQSSRQAQRKEQRLTAKRVSRIISMIGEQARIVVQQPDEEAGRRLKYASAHDLRRGCAHRLINAGVSAETLKIILRHKDFATTEKFYGATKAAQAAAGEVHEKLAGDSSKQDSEDGISQFSAEELKKLRSLLNSI